MERETLEEVPESVPLKRNKVGGAEGREWRYGPDFTAATVGGVEKNGAGVLGFMENAR